MTELNRPVMEDEKLWGSDYGAYTSETVDVCGRGCRVDLLYGGKNRFCTGQNILIDGLEAGNCNFIWP